MTDRTPPPGKARAQLEFIQEEDGSVTIVVYDPAAFDNWDPDADGIVDLAAKLDPSNPIVEIISTMLTACSYLGPVHKIVDARKGRSIDVSDRNWEKMLEGVSRKKWSKSHIRETYDERVARGVIDPDEFPFEEFERDFRENNQ